MDRLSSEHSDSDSGESWTILDNNPEVNESTSDANILITPNKSIVAENLTIDDDTDGISIISEGETDLSSTMQLIDSSSDAIEGITRKEGIVSSNLIEENHANIAPASIVDYNIISNNNKQKIYVHRRNNRLSTVLNIMMLMSVMTAAGVAIGHMWGARNDCSPDKTPLLNSILSDLYKLQEENMMYQRQLLEISTFIENEFRSSFNPEESKNNKDKIDKTLKFIRDKTNNKRSVSQNLQNNIERLQQYQIEPKLSQNQSNSITKLKMGEQEKIEPKKLYDTVYNKQPGECFSFTTTVGQTFPRPEYEKSNKFKHENKDKTNHEDSLKFNHTNKNIYKRNANFNTKKNNIVKLSDRDLITDTRYSTQKYKLELKKRDRYKPFKNLRKRNKYENLDLKEGLQRYYDDLSMKLLDSNDYLKSNIGVDNKKLDEQLNNIDREPLNNKTNAGLSKTADANQRENRQQLSNWYNDRVQLRKEARKKRKRDLVSQITPSTGEWYFRRMRKREQCRAKDKCNKTNAPGK